MFEGKSMEINGPEPILEPKEVWKGRSKAVS